MTERLGYLVPEFPGQTHIFYWREIEALEQMGASLDLVSTRLPASKIMSHSWASIAQQRTTYLLKPDLGRWVGAIGQLLKAGLVVWLTCLRTVFSAKHLSVTGTLRLLVSIFLGAELAYIAQKRQWNHVHVHSCADAANIALFAHLISSLSYSMTLHGPLRDYGGNQAQKWSHASFAIVITETLHREVQQQLSGHLPPKLLVVPMGVNPSTFVRNKPYLPWDGGICRLFSVGRLNPCKGHDTLIRAMAALVQHGIAVNLEIAGEEDDQEDSRGYRKELEVLIQQLNLQNAVRLLGAVSEERVRAGLENAHVFALASLHEPLGVATMEAMAMEVPAVVTDTGGVKELVEHGVDGFLVEPLEPEQIAEAVLLLLKSPELAIRIGQAGRQKVEQHFHSSRSAQVLFQRAESTPAVNVLT